MCLTAENESRLATEWQKSKAARISISGKMIPYAELHVKSCPCKVCTFFYTLVINKTVSSKQTADEPAFLADARLSQCVES